MNYQYQQMPQQQMINPLELKKQKQAKVFAFCDKLNNAIGDNKFVRPLLKPAQFISYAIVAVSFILTLIFLIAEPLHQTYNFIPYIPLIFSVIAICNKKILPMAVNLSFLGFFYIANFICTIINLGGYGYYTKGSSIFTIIFSIIELAVVATAAVIAWIQFANSLEPKIPVYPTYAMPQQPVAPVAPAPQAAPVQPVAAPVEAPAAAPVQEAASQVTYCPKCGTQNTAGSGFCKSCGTKLN